MSYVPTYCKPEHIVSLLRLVERGEKFEVSEESFPSKTDFENWIAEAESYIEEKTSYSWRATILNESHTNKGWAIYYGIRCIVVDLDKKDIITFDTPSGDYIKVRTSPLVEEDIIQTKTKGEYFGDGDFYIDNEYGKIYLYGSINPLLGRGMIKVRYRYGDITSMPEVIREVVTKLVALNFLTGEDYLHLMPDNPSAIDLSTKAERFRTRVEHILEDFDSIVYN